MLRGVDDESFKCFIFLNSIAILILGFRFYEHEKEYSTHAHEKSLADINKHLSQIDLELSSIDIENLKQTIFNDFFNLKDKVKDPVTSKSSKNRNDPTTEYDKKVKENHRVLYEERKELAGTFHSTAAASVEPFILGYQPKRKAIQFQASDNIETRCLLMSFDNSTFVQSFQHDDIPPFSKSFDLQLKVKTDKYPEETHWILSSPLNNQEQIVDSLADKSTEFLLKNTLHTFEYKCFVGLSEEDEDGDPNEEKICFDFEIFDVYEDGMCCWVSFIKRHLQK